MAESLLPESRPCWQNRGAIAGDSRCRALSSLRRRISALRRARTSRRILLIWSASSGGRLHSAPERAGSRSPCRTGLCLWAKSGSCSGRKASLRGKRSAGRIFPPLPGGPLQPRSGGCPSSRILCCAGIRPCLPSAYGKRMGADNKKNCAPQNELDRRHPAPRSPLFAVHFFALQKRHPFLPEGQKVDSEKDGMQVQGAGFEPANTLGDQIS